MNTPVYIYDSVRTPRGKGKSDGSLHIVRPVTLASFALKSLTDRQSIPLERIEDVIFGCVTQIGEQGGCIAKAATLYAGLPYSVAAQTLNRFCGSGLEAIGHAAAKIGSGMNDLIIAGGVESMSRVPMGDDGGPMMSDPDVSSSIGFIPQGISADLIATLRGYGRRDLDQWAVRSHQRASHAQEQNYFRKSLIPVKDKLGQSYLSYDEMVRSSTTMESLAKLTPSFSLLGEKYGFDKVAIKKYPELEKIFHLHHAGNSSSMVDGAAAIYIGSEKIQKELNITPRARIRSYAITGSEPTIMLTGLIPATQMALKKADLTIDDVDLFEINEAFASVVLNTMDQLKIPEEKVNVNGGAIALGHPLGATGAMLVSSLIDELERIDKRIGLVTLCIGGGMGIAMVIERGS